MGRAGGGGIGGRPRRSIRSHSCVPLRWRGCMQGGHHAHMRQHALIVSIVWLRRVPRGRQLWPSTRACCGCSGRAGCRWVRAARWVPQHRTRHMHPMRRTNSAQFQCLLILAIGAQGRQHHLRGIRMARGWRLAAHVRTDAARARPGRVAGPIRAAPEALPQRSTFELRSQSPVPARARAGRQEAAQPPASGRLVLPGAPSNDSPRSRSQPASSARWELRALAAPRPRVPARRSRAPARAPDTPARVANNSVARHASR